MNNARISLMDFRECSDDDGKMKSRKISPPPPPIHQISSLSIDGVIDDAHEKATIISNASRPSTFVVHASLVLGQIFFGLGSVIAALGLPACNPFAFALYRELAAGGILLVAAMGRSSHNVSDVLRDYRRFLVLGLTVFGNQAGMIAGIKLAGPVIAAVWQPSQPIMTAFICMVLGWEPTNRRRIAGVLVAFVGCGTMVIISAKEETQTANPQMAQGLVGHSLFFINCLCTSLYVILSKQPLQFYSPLVVTAWAYVIAAVFMALTAFSVSLSEPTMKFLCPDCTGTWNVPSGAWFALLYFILFNSVGAYVLLTWANQHTTGTLVIAYTVLQPVTAAALMLLLLGTGMYSSCATTSSARCVNPPGFESVLGMIGVFAGLALVIHTEPAKTPIYEPVKSRELM